MIITAKEIREGWGDACEEKGANPFSPWGLAKLDELVDAALSTIADQRDTYRKALENIEFCPRSMSENVWQDMQQTARAALAKHKPIENVKEE